jgi:hypothetical protein
MTAVLPVRTLALLALTALAGCGDHITAPAPAADDGLNPAAVTAAAAPVRSVEIRKLSMGSKKLTLDGTAVPYTVTLRNPGAELQEVFLQGMVLQAGADRGAGGVYVLCGAAPGVLPSGTCSMEWTASVDNNLPGTGTLVPGPAEFVLTLWQGNETTVALDEVRVRIMLVAP